MTNEQIHVDANAVFSSKDISEVADIAVRLRTQNILKIVEEKIGKCDKELFGAPSGWNCALLTIKNEIEKL